jgi:hypothetical protein
MDEPDLSSYPAYNKQKSEIVPQKISRDKWFEACLKRMAQRLRETVPEECESEKPALEVLEIMEDLLLSADQRSKSEDDLSPLLVC